MAGNIAYNSLLKKQGKTQCHPIRDEDLKEWVLWMTTIFMPLNDVREKIIIENAHLIVEEQMPQCLLDFVTHVVGYKALLADWAEGNYAERRSTIGWPPEFDAYVERSYQALKAEQTRLLHHTPWRNWLRGRKAQSSPEMRLKARLPSSRPKAMTSRTRFICVSRFFACVWQPRRLERWRRDSLPRLVRSGP